MKYKIFLIVVFLISNINLNAQLKPILSSTTIKNLTNFQVYKQDLLSKLTLYSSTSQTRSFNVGNSNIEVITVGNQALYPVPVKNKFQELSTPVCNFLPVNYKSSQMELGMLFPASNFQNAIYPGAVYRFNTLVNSSPAPYTRYTIRNPMDARIDVITNGVNQTNTSEIRSFSYNNIMSLRDSKLNQMYQSGVRYGEVFTDVILAESNSQLNTTMNNANRTSVGTQLSFPLPDIPVNVDVSNNVTVTNTSSISTNSENKKNSVVIKVRKVFYTYSMLPKAPGAQFDVFPGIDKSTLENDLIYVSSVDYGMDIYIVVTSEVSKSDLMKAVMNKVSTETTLGVRPPVDLPVSGSVTVGTSNQTSNETNQVFSNSNTTVSVRQYGGPTLPLVTNIDEAITAVKSVLANSTFDIRLGAPISYTLNFVADHSPAWVNTNTSYATTNCGRATKPLSEMRYDVDLKLVKLTAFNVVEGTSNDLDEDIYGTLYLDKFESGNTILKGRTYFFQKNGNTFNTSPYDDPNGVANVLESAPYLINNSKRIAGNITNNVIVNANLHVTGTLFDKELIPVSYTCTNCNGSPRIIPLSTYAAPINQMLPGDSKPLNIGRDAFFELIFEEKPGQAGTSLVKAWWQIIITAK